MHLREDFIFEIGTEELPAKILPLLETALLKNTETFLSKSKLDYQGDIQSFATPRRLAIFISQLQTQQPDQVIERKGPSVQAAFEADGKPSAACVGFAKSCGVEINELQKRETPQGEWLYAVQKKAGQSALQIMPAVMQLALDKLPIVKPMRWGSHPYSFLRPVRWVLMMLGSEVIPAIFYDQKTTNITYGHRFMAHEALQLDHARNYETILEQKAKVIPNFSKRQALISDQLQQAAKKLNAQAIIHEDLLNEVTGLVEWPEVLPVKFDSRFLNVPKNALISAMETHQKSFALINAANDLLPSFLVVSNLVSNSPEQVMIGNARVMNARLSDAEFFYQQDLLVPFADYLPDLKHVVFQTKLGSLYTKSEALAQMAEKLASAFEFQLPEITRLAMLTKCDLRSQMVGEFPELQGEMGEIYAIKSGCNAEIAKAIFEQYLPRFANDQLPATQMGICFALADRIVNLIGIFGVGLIPTGDKDPFGLRRAAIGVCRILIENELTISLVDILLKAQTIWQSLGVNFENATDSLDQVQQFIIERLKNIYLEQMYSPQVVQSVLSLGKDDLYDIDRRIKAVSQFAQTEAAVTLSAAQKRVHNILKQEKILVEDLKGPNPSRFELEQEPQLMNALTETQIVVGRNLMDYDYAAALENLSHLKQPVDAFFDGVMVMVENPTVRHNRLCLLGELYKSLNQVANISLL